jgi:amino acid transporter
VGVVARGLGAGRGPGRALRVDLNGRVLGVLLCAEVAVLLVLAVAGLGDPAAGVPLTSLTPGGLFGHDGVGALLVIALLGYVGFEAAAVAAEQGPGIPMVQLFFWLGTSGAFGVLCLLATTSIAVITFFARDPRGENAWRRPIAPALATLALLAMVWAGLANYATLLGVAPGSTEAWALPAAFAGAGALGVGYGIWLRSARPSVYRGIGLGADAGG